MGTRKDSAREGTGRARAPWETLVLCGWKNETPSGGTFRRTLDTGFILSSNTHTGPLNSPLQRWGAVFPPQGSI